jgi:hypothetical protein
MGLVKRAVEGVDEDPIRPEIGHKQGLATRRHDGGMGMRAFLPSVRTAP